MKSYNVYIPRSLDVDDLMATNPPRKRLKKDKLCYILHVIHVTPFLRPENHHKGLWVIINAQNLKSIISNYKDYLDYLTEADLIRSNNCYVAGERSKGYQFIEMRYRVSQSQKIMVTDRTLLTALSRRREAESDRTNKAIKKYPKLAGWFNDSLTIDFTSDFSELVHDHYGAINRNEYYFSVDAFGKRFHSNLTNLKGDYRQYLRYDGAPLVELDIKTSQPFLSLYLLMDRAFQVYPELTSSLRLLDTNENKIEEINSKPALNGLGQFMSDVLQHDLYQAVMAPYNDVNGRHLSQRSESKELIFQMMYARPSLKHPMARMYKRYYPFVIDTYNELKRNDHKDFSKKLQRTESQLILDVICKRIAEEGPDVPIFTIHDALLTTEPNVEYVKGIMTAEIKSFVGLEPIVRVG